MTSKKSNEIVQKDAGETFEVGTPIVVLRPSLWSGAVGVVESVNEFNVHRVVIAGKDGATFHADVPGSQLRFDV